MAEGILSVEHLSVSYGRVSAVRDVTFEVAAGEVVGLVGPNGAGKSTTLSGIMGLLSIASGDVTVDGVSVAGWSPDRIARRGLALVPEGRHIFPDFTVRENMRLGMLGRAGSAGIQRDLAWVHELFPVVAEFAERTAGQLSGGQQQQLAIARALISSPRVLMLDEPSLGLAPNLVDALFAALTQVREEGVAILLVEQRAQLTVAFADRTHVMRSGSVVETLGPGDADDTARMSEAYFG